MSHNVTEADTYADDVPLPDFSTLAYVDDVPEAFQVLADRTRHHNNTLKLTSGAEVETIGFNSQTPEVSDITVPLSGRAELLRDIGLNLHRETRWLRERCLGVSADPHKLIWNPKLISYNGASWSDQVYNSPTQQNPYILQSDLSQTYATIDFPILPANTFISTIDFQVASPISHAGIFPEYMPNAALIGITSAGVVTEIASSSDPSTTLSTYEATHTISIPAYTFRSGTRAYSLKIRGEDGGNGKVGSFRIYRVTATVWYISS